MWYIFCLHIIYSLLSYSFCLLLEKKVNIKQGERKKLIVEANMFCDFFVYIVTLKFVMDHGGFTKFWRIQ